MLDDRSNEEFVRYENVQRRYLERRQLAKGAPSHTWLLLWGVGVGATIWAYFSLFSLPVSFGPLAVAIALMAVVYGCFVFCVAELAAALPHTGGFYAFTRIAFGPLAGFICGVGLLIAYLLMSALMAVGIGGYLSTLLPEMPSSLGSLLLLLLLLYVIFLVINIRSTRWGLTVGLILTLLALLVLCLLIVEGVPTQDEWFIRLTDSTQLASLSGWPEVFAALPFAACFYLGLEQMPLLAEESHDATHNLPKALKAGLVTLVILSFVAVLLSIVTDEGATEVTYPLGLIGLIGLLATFQAMMVAYGRLLFALSRAGYLPYWLSLTSRTQTPNRALIMGSLVSLMIASVLAWRGGLRVSGAEMGNQTLLGAVVASAMLSYALVMASYIKLKKQDLDLPRPYISPLGQLGAVAGLIGAMMILLAGLFNDAYRAGMVGVAFFLFFSLLYFLFVSSQRLVAQAPEEKLALRGDPVMIRRLIVTRVMVLLAVIGSIYGSMRVIMPTLDSVCPPECGGVSLIREDFSGADLSQANFVFANLLQADLSEANLRGVDLSGANLSEATLANADLSDAKLIGADLSDADLGRAIVSNADMSGAKLNEGQLTHVDLTEASLKGVNLQQAELIGADLSGLNLAGVEFTAAQMKEVNLSGANLAGSTLSDADLSGADLTGADLAGAWLNRSNLTGANLSGADLSGASLIGANLTSAQLDGVQLVGANLIGATMARTNLRGANLKAVRWKKSHLVEQDLSLDSTLANLNELELNQWLKDAQISAIQFDSQTIWPNNEFYGR